MIYTTSCAGKNIDDLKPLLTRLDARLVDVRFTPSEMPLKWSKTYLQILLKRQYQHLPALGLREINSGKFAIQNLTLGLKILGEEDFNVVLFCDCADYESCHRKTINQELLRLGIDTEKIEYWS